MVSKLQNCELKQEPRTQATALNQPHNFHNRERKFFFTFAGLGWNCSEIETSRRIFVLTHQLVLTYNFATGKFVSTSHTLRTLTSTLQLVSSFQNCELKQEPRTLATALNQPHNFHNRERKFFFTFAGLGWNCSEIETSRRIFVLTHQLVLTYNFATGKFVSTSHTLRTLTTALQLVSSFQNCELKQEPRTLATALHQPHKFHNRERKYFFKPAGMGWNCSEIETSRRIFVLTLNRASALTVSDKR
ncbi:MAG TPA: hypothetical protein PLE33_08845 [Candidatus Cloacimonas sp.]|nr:hypothetical protein [Candidatus Cloacimonas sp.]